MISIKKIVNQIVEDEDKGLIDVIFDVTSKINNLPNKTTTNIAKLIDYKPEKSFINPLTQGKIACYVSLVCKEINIKLEQNRDNIGGLAYFNEFEIVRENNMDNITNEKIDIRIDVIGGDHKEIFDRYKEYGDIKAFLYLKRNNDEEKVTSVFLNLLYVDLLKWFDNNNLDKKFVNFNYIDEIIFEEEYLAIEFQNGKYIINAYGFMFVLSSKDEAIDFGRRILKEIETTYNSLGDKGRTVMQKMQKHVFFYKNHAKYDFCSLECRGNDDNYIILRGYIPFGNEKINLDTYIEEYVEEGGEIPLKYLGRRSWREKYLYLDGQTSLEVEDYKKQFFQPNTENYSSMCITNCKILETIRKNLYIAEILDGLKIILRSREDLKTGKNYEVKGYIWLNEESY